MDLLARRVLLPVFRMKVFSCLLLLALAIVADAGMMGPPPGVGGPGGGLPGAFVKPPPPPFVQAIIASKGKPFGAAAVPPSAAPQPMDPSLFGPPAYLQGLMAAKAASIPFMPPSIPMGPPKFVTDLIAAKQAADAALAQQLATMTPAPPPNNTAPAAIMGPSPVGGIPPFVQNIIAQKGSPSATSPAAASPAAAAPPDWIQALIQQQIAKKLAAGPEPSAPQLQPQPQLPMGLQQRRQLASDSQQQVGGSAPQAPLYPPMTLPPGYPPMGPVPYPMMPFYPPMMPMWKMMG